MPPRKISRRRATIRPVIPNFVYIPGAVKKQRGLERMVNQQVVKAIRKMGAGLIVPPQGIAKAKASMRRARRTATSVSRSRKMRR